jgi:hypothetical protein
MASSGYDGRCLALQVDRSGLVIAAVATATGLQIHQLAPTGARTQTTCRSVTEPVAAAFFGERRLAVWQKGGVERGGRLLAFAVAPEDLAQAKGLLSPAWSHEPGFASVALQPMAGAVALIGAGSDGIPNICVVYGHDGKILMRETLAEGIYTAWSSAVPAGGLTLGGAARTPAGVQPFIRHLGPDQKPLFTAVPADGPPLLLATSATGSHVVAVTLHRASSWSSDGKQGWSRRLAGRRAVMLCAFGDGSVALASAESTLIIDPQGQVARRWRTLSPGPVAQAGAVDYVVSSLPGGAVVLGPTGLRQAIVGWDGPTELVAIDPGAGWLARASGATLSLHALRGGSATAP